MQYVRFLRSYFLWLLSFATTHVVAIDVATQTTKHSATAPRPSSVISIGSLISSALSLSTATVVTVGGEVISIDTQRDVFVNGIEVLTESQRSTMATSSYVTDPAASKRHESSSAVKSHKATQTLPLTATPPHHSPNSVSQAGFNKPTNSAEESSMVAAIVAAINSVHLMSAPTEAAGHTLISSRSSSFSQSGRTIPAIAVHSSSGKATSPIGKGTTSTRNPPITSAVAGHLSSPSAPVSHQQSRKNNTPTSANKSSATTASVLKLASSIIGTSQHLATSTDGSQTTATSSVTNGPGGVIPVPPVVLPGGGGLAGPGGVPINGPGNEPGQPGSSNINSRPKESSLQTPSMTTFSTRTSSTSSSTPSCSSCDSCIDLHYAPSTTPDELGKREGGARIGGRFYLDRRGRKPMTRTVVAGGKCTMSKYTYKPPYPGPASVANNEGPSPVPSMVKFYQTAAYWAIPTQVPCNHAPGWGFVDTNQLAAQPQPYQLGGDVGTRVNIDHVYEVGLLDEFFLYQSGSVTCAEMAAVFDTHDTINGGTRLNTIFAQLPSYNSPDFLGMDAGLNSFKGTLWNPNLQDLPDLTALPMNNDGVMKRLVSLNNLALIMDMARDPVVFKLFESTNARIYEAFQGIDTALSQCHNTYLNSAGHARSWASDYKDWMLRKVASQNHLITSTASEWSKAVPTNFALFANTVTPRLQQSQLANWRVYISNYNALFPIDQLTFPTPTHWPTAPLPIGKRQVACTPSPSSLSQHSVTPTPVLTPTTPTAAATSAIQTHPSLVQICLGNSAVDYAECPAIRASAASVVSAASVAAATSATQTHPSLVQICLGNSAVDYAECPAIRASAASVVSAASVAAATSAIHTHPSLVQICLGNSAVDYAECPAIRASAASVASAAAATPTTPPLAPSSAITWLSVCLYANNRDCSPITAPSTTVAPVIGVSPILSPLGLPGIGAPCDPLLGPNCDPAGQVITADGAATTAGSVPLVPVPIIN